ncbi:MAG: hypothetical protein ACLGPL_07970, partial [Acidobacteriota bacterium]
MKKLSKSLLATLWLAALASLTWSEPTLAATKHYLMWALPASGISYPVYVYSNGVQVDYVYGPSQQAFVGPYDPVTTSGSYELYYQKNGAWRDCKMVMANGKIDATGTTCPGAVINNPHDRSNVYTITTGALAWPASATPPVNPLKTDFGKRKITFVNNTQYDLIQVGEVCTKAQN